MGDDESIDDEGEILPLEANEEHVDKKDEPPPTRLCTALEFLGASDANSGGKTFEFEGAIAGIPVVILVDSGATHNFVSRQLVTALGLSSSMFSGINIQLGDDHKVFVNHRCTNLKVRVGTCEFEVDALVFDMGHLDVVLGME